VNGLIAGVTPAYKYLPVTRGFASDWLLPFSLSVQVLLIRFE
jgi:hypothetical protein